MVQLSPSFEMLTFVENVHALGLKENGQNPDSGSKNSENQNNDAVS